MTPDELTRLKELHAQATPGPWYLNTFGDYAEIVDGDNDTVLSLGFSRTMGRWEREDATFAIEVRNAFPGLLAYIEKLTQRAERAEKRLARINRQNPKAYEQALTGETP